MEMRTVLKKGVMFHGVLFHSRELCQLIGQQVYIDDLDIPDTPEVLVRNMAGEVLCSAESTSVLPYRPSVMGRFERELRKRGIIDTKKPPM